MTLIDAGVGITVMTSTDGAPVIDERPVDPEEVGEELVERVIKIHENDEQLQSPKPIVQAGVDEYDAVVPSGGHGTA